jgi:hypothetical protein
MPFPALVLSRHQARKAHWKLLRHLALALSPQRTAVSTTPLPVFQVLGL